MSQIFVAFSKYMNFTATTNGLGQKKMWWKFAICFLSRSKQLFRRRLRASGGHVGAATASAMPRQLA